MSDLATLRNKEFKMKDGSTVYVKGFLECKGTNEDGKIMLNFLNRKREVIAVIDFMEVESSQSLSKSKMPKSDPKLITEDVKAKAIELKKQQLTYEEIGNRLGISTSQAYRILKLAGLTGKTSVSTKNPPRTNNRRACPKGHLLNKGTMPCPRCHPHRAKNKQVD